MLALSDRICQECGSTIESRVEGVLCLDCLYVRYFQTPQEAIEWEEERRRGEAIRQLKQELDIPADAHCSEFTRRGNFAGPEWNRYHLWMLGMSTGCEEWPPPWPFFKMGPFLYQVRIRQVYVDGLPAFIEARWHPERGETISMHGLEGIKRKRDIAAVAKGMDLLVAFDGLGRPSGTTLYTVEEFAVMFRKAWHTIQSRSGKKPTQYELAAECSLSKSQLNVYLKRYKEAGFLYPPNSPD
jgi:hypothetical protein